MKEGLVTFKTAKLLKEKGFDERTLYGYQNNGMLYCNADRIAISYNSLPIYQICAPIQSFAQKWLRETNNLHIAIIRNACGYGYDICKADNGTHITDGVFDGPNDGGQWDTYEEALEVGIQEALKLI